MDKPDDKNKTRARGVYVWHPVRSMAD